MGKLNEESFLREVPDLATLHELLARLNESESEPVVSRSEKITVEDIAEALGLDPNHVASELEELLEDQRNARLSKALRELEEPLYSVERTGHSTIDPLGNPLYKLRSVQILTEKNRDRVQVPRREFTETKTDRMSQMVGKFMLLLVFILMALLGLKAILTIALQR